MKLLNSELIPHLQSCRRRVVNTLHKKWSFSLRISSVKSVVSCGFVLFTEKILNGNLHFLCSVHLSFSLTSPYSQACNFGLPPLPPPILESGIFRFSSKNSTMRLKKLMQYLFSLIIYKQSLQFSSVFSNWQQIEQILLKPSQLSWKAKITPVSLL